MDKLQLEQMAQPIIDLYYQLEHNMLVNLAATLKDKKELFRDDPEVFRIQQLQQLGMLDKTNLEEIRKLTGLLPNEINKLLYEAGVEGISDQEDQMLQALAQGAELLNPAPVVESLAILDILKAYAAQATNILNLTNQTMLDQAKQTYIDGLNKAVLDLASGFKTHDQALREVIRGWAEKGIPALVDKAGRKWAPEGYVRTVLITTTNNTINQMQDTRFDEYGVDLVEVTSHLGARPLCAPYQGKIFRISDKPKYAKYKHLYTQTSYGQPAGLFGINCGHRKYPFFEGISTQRYKPYDEKENDKAYKESQVQRGLERAIRKAKTQKAMYQAAGDPQGAKEADKLIKKRQAKMSEFIEETGRTRRRNREQIHSNKTGPIKTTASGVSNPSGDGKKLLDKHNGQFDPSPEIKKDIDKYKADQEKKKQAELKKIQEEQAKQAAIQKALEEKQAQELKAKQEAELKKQKEEEQKQQEILKQQQQSQSIYSKADLTKAAQQFLNDSPTGKKNQNAKSILKDVENGKTFDELAGYKQEYLKPYLTAKPEMKEKGIVDIPKEDMKPVDPPKSVPAPKPSQQASEFKVVHKNYVEDQNGIITMTNPIYVKNGKEEIHIGILDPHAVTKTSKNGTKIATTDGYDAILNNGKKAHFSTMKAGKEWMLKEYLKDNGIAEKAKEEPKIVDPDLNIHNINTKKIVKGDTIKFVGQFGDTYEGKVDMVYGKKFAVIDDDGEKILGIKKDEIISHSPDKKDTPDLKPESVYKGLLANITVGDEITYESSPGTYDKAKIDKLYTSGSKVGVTTSDGKKSIVMVEDIVVIGKKNEDQQTVPAVDPGMGKVPKAKVKAKKAKPKSNEVPKQEKAYVPKEGDKIDVTVSGKEFTGTIKKIGPKGIIILDTDEGLIVVDPNKDKISGAGSNQKTAEERLKKAGFKKIYDFAKFERIGQHHKDVVRDHKILTDGSVVEENVKTIKYYTSNNYTKINGYLRKGHSSNDDMNDLIKLLSKTLEENASPLSQDTLLFRRIGQRSIKDIFDEEILSLVQNSVNKKPGALESLKDRLIGGAIHDKAYMSSTHIEGSFGNPYDININIYAPKGYKGGMFIESVTVFKGEYEYLLNKGKKLNIHDVRVVNGRIFFDVVPDDV